MGLEITPEQAELAEIKQRKIWQVVLFCTVFVGIVLVVAIVALAIARNNRSNEGTVVEYTDSAFKTYEEYTDEITQKLSEANEFGDTQATLALYQEYIEKAEDEQTKALLQGDYYMAIMAGDTTYGQMGTVIEGLTAVDDVLKTQASALAVLNAAYYYNATDVTTKYMGILEERGFTGNVGSLDNTSGGSSPDNTSDESSTNGNDTSNGADGEGGSTNEN